MRTWTRLVPAVLLALPLTMTPARAGNAETNEQKIAKLRTEVDEIRQELKTLQVQLAAIKGQGTATDEKLNRILNAMERLANAQQDLITRRSAYAPLPTQDNLPPAAPAPTTGTITVRNQYTAMAHIRINGREYTVPPGRDARISGVPVGPYNYEVEVDGYGLVLPLRTETLRPNGRIITVYPQYGG